MKDSKLKIIAVATLLALSVTTTMSCYYDRRDDRDYYGHRYDDRYDRDGRYNARRDRDNDRWDGDRWDRNRDDWRQEHDRD